MAVTAADITEFTNKKVALEAQRTKMLAETTAFNTLHADFVKEIEKVGKEMGLKPGEKKSMVLSIENKIKIAEIILEPDGKTYGISWIEPVQGVS